MGDAGVKHAQTKMESVLAMIWDELCEKIWKKRNAILHSKDSKVAEDKMTNIADKLTWYQQHRDAVLDYRHRYLVNHTSKDVERGTRATR